jgi:multidrug efflux pump
VISNFFIDRPIFATVLSVVITLIGFIALLFLPVAQYPRITPPGVVVSISYPGANAQVVADTVAAPIEQQVNGVPGMLYMSSQMGNDGTYSLTVTFDIGTDLKSALVMVQNRVALAMPQLPIEVQSQGITIRKKTPDILMIVNFYSPNGRYDDVYLSNFATINVRDQLLRVEGVSDITYQGERDYSIRIWVDPQKLAATNITAVDVANAIRSENVDAPAGQIGQPPSPRGQSVQMPIDTLGRLNEPSQFGDIIIKVGQPPPAPPTMQIPAPASGTMGAAIGMGGGNTGGGGTTGGGANTGGGGTTGGGATGGTITVAAVGDTGGDQYGVVTGATQGRGPGLASTPVVRLRDVARLEMGAQNYTQSCTFDGHPSVGLSVYQLPGTNALDVADAVRAKMEELKKSFPDDVEYDIGYDTTPYIRESVWDVVKTLIEAVVLVGVVVLFFLQDWRAMILPLIDVPVSIIGTFAVMAGLSAVGDALKIPSLNFSLNNVSLFGLVLAIGIVVDDAIVVLENIERMMAKGYDARTATIKAMAEVTGPIIAVSLVLCAVFVPCAFIRGIIGQFFNQFAVTIAVSTLISALNAITMTPSRAVLIFKKEEQVGAASRAAPPAPLGSRGVPHEHRREALPWWIFGVLAGLLTVWLGQRFLGGQVAGYLARQLGVPPPGPLAPKWLSWAVGGVYFVPGAALGLPVGWFIIRPVNAVLAVIFRGFNAGFDWMTAGYGWVVGKSLRVYAVVLVAYVGLLGLTYWTFHKAPVGFIPQQDQGRLIVSIQLPDATSLERTQEVTAEVDRIARATPGVSHTVAFAGMSFLLQANSSNFASMFVVLDPFDERQSPDRRDTAIMRAMQRGWAKSPKLKDAELVVRGAAPIPGLGTAGGFKIMIEDRGGLGLVDLEKQTDAVIRELKKQPGLNGVSTQFRSKTPQYFLDIDRSKAAALGVALDDVNQTLDMFLGSRYVNSYNDFGRHWQVTVQAEGRYRNQVNDINLFKVRNNKGQMVPLGTLVKPRETGGPISLTRYNLSTAASISGNIQGVSTGDAINNINKTTAETLPLSMKTEWTEVMFMQLRAGNTAMYVFLLAIICVFLALSALYESWALPLAVILVVPLCLLCSIAAVLFTKRDVNIFVQIGFVVLVGLACKNAILVVEYAKQLHTEGRSIFDATKEASKLRLRPILMTSFAFIFGVLPLVFASGAGAEMRRSLGTAVFSGMLGVTLFGIFLTPVFFYVIVGLGATQLFASAAMRWVGSCVTAGLLGGAIGFILGKLGVVRLLWGPPVGAAAGVLLMLFFLEIFRRIKSEPVAAQLPANGDGAGPFRGS